MGHVTVKANNAPDRSDWLTPGWFLDLVRRVGPIELDPATNYGNPTSADLYYARDWPADLPRPANLLGPCGLSGAWRVPGLVFVNPPWGAHLSGKIDPERVITRKDRQTGQIRVLGRGTGWAERIARHEGEALTLVPTRTDSSWFGRLHAWCSWRVDWRSPTLGARIQFIDPDTGKTRGGNNTACTVFYRGPRSLAFLQAFGPHGEIVPGRSTLAELFRLGA